MPSLEDQIQIKTADEVEQTALDLAQANELPVTGWGAGRVARTTWRYIAVAVADVFFAVTQIAHGVLIGREVDGTLFSRNLWLTRALKSHFDEERTPAGPTSGQAVLVDHGGGPHTVTNGACYVGTQGEAVRFKVTAGGGTLALNGSLTVTIQAEKVGAAGNVANGAITRMITSLPTVTVSNPPIGVTGTWITVLGTDVESDESATDRAPLKWATLATSSPPAAYLHWALTTPGVTRATVDDGNPNGPNTVGVYVDNAGSVTALQTTLDVKQPSGTAATAAAATALNVTIPGVVTVRRGLRTQAEAEIEENLEELALDIDIGGVVREAEIIERTMAPDGVVDFVMGSSWTGTPNIQLGATEYPQFTLSLTFEEVE